eukprot:01663.XXX_1543_1818_1 [CDS] Oithona nana genome sequencing.
MQRFDHFGGLTQIVGSDKKRLLGTLANPGQDGKSCGILSFVGLNSNSCHSALGSFKDFFDVDIWRHTSDRFDSNDSVVVIDVFATFLKISM